MVYPERPSAEFTSIEDVVSSISKTFDEAMLSALMGINEN
jgi:hypothetical protein